MSYHPSEPSTGIGWLCEDLAVIDDTTILAACGHQEAHNKWYPPKDSRDYSEDRNDEFFLFDLQTHQFHRLSVLGMSEGEDLRLHGIDFDPESNEVLAVNHQRSGSVVDRFLLHSGDLSMTMISRYSDPRLIITPNGVSFFKSQDVSGVFITNDHRKLTGIGRLIEEYSQLPNGFLTFCYDAGDLAGSCIEMATLKYPNVHIFSGIVNILMN